MNLLTGEQVLALDSAIDSHLARFLASLGADVRAMSPDSLDDASVAGAGFLLEVSEASMLVSRGWTDERFERLAPRLIRVSVTTFGAGPREAWRGGELVASAMGGVLAVTGPPDRPPVKEADDACGFHAQMVAAAGALAALQERAERGTGQRVDVSVQEVALSRQVNGILAWQFDRRKLARVSDSLNYGIATVRCIWPLKDGWCFHTLMSGRFGAPANQALSEWMDQAGVDNPLRGVDWVKYDRSRLDPEVRTVWEKAIAAFFVTRSKAEIRTEGRQRGINAAVIADPADVLADEQLAVRRFWTSGEGVERLPSRFVSVTSTPQQSAPRGPGSGAGERRGPLHGVRVLDFSWALVGSITTKTLGDLGAEVIKVESRTRPCLTRIDVQVKASKPGSFDDKPWFAHLNTSKKSLALDMKKPESREVLLPLIDWADVVVENFSPGTMKKLGLDYEALSRRNPGVILVSGSIYGQTGPMAGEWGVDGTGGALSGRTYLTGWPDRGPVIPGAVPYGDVIVPYVMAAAVPAALHFRRTHGRGCHIDASMFEICVQQMRRSVIDAQRGALPQRSGNADPRMFHQGVFPVQESGRFIAIETAGEADWRRLARIAGWDGTSLEASIRSGAARDSLLLEWCCTQPGVALMQRLQAEGLAAGMVQDIEDLLEADPQIRARKTLVGLPHPLLGEFGHLRTPISFSKTRSLPFRPPGIGEHSAQVARELAGLSDARIAELEALEVFR